MSYYPGFYPDTVKTECHRYTYGRQPYIRITLEDGTVVDGKAHAWQGNRVLANWEDETGARKSLWMDKQHAVRIPYRESRWHDSTSADDIMWLAEQGELYTPVITRQSHPSRSCRRVDVERQNQSPGEPMYSH